MIKLTLKTAAICAVSIGLAACTGASAPEAVNSHGEHSHVHASNCGHISVQHEGHTDYLHDGHLHHVAANGVKEHVIAVSDANPDGENPVAHTDHDGHTHGEGDSLHAMIPHGDHMDYLHDGHLHHVHGDHVDEHGAL